MKTWPPAFILRVSDARSLFGFLRCTKERLVLAIALLATFQLYGQGTVNLSNFLLNAPVYNAQTCLDAIAGTTFSVALYSAPYDPANPVPPNPSAMTQAGAAAPLVAAGIYFDGTRTASNITPPGSLGWFQVKAWETAFGATYEQAQTNPAALIGVSNIILVLTGDPGPPPVGIPGNLIGISGITLSAAGTPPCVPEGSPVVLGFLGAALLSLLRAKNQSS
jgi:hypothetical protein